MPAKLGLPKAQNPLIYFESYTDLALSAMYSTNSISNTADSTASNPRNYFCWQPASTKQTGLNNCFKAVTLDGTNNTANAYPIIVIPKSGLFEISAQINVGIPKFNGTNNAARDILILGKNYGANYIRQNTAPTGWMNASNPYPITNRDNGTASTSVPPAVVLATATLDYDANADNDNDDHRVLQLSTNAYLKAGDDVTLALVIDQLLNSSKGTISQAINSVQMQIVSLTGYDGQAQTDASMLCTNNPGYSYSTV